MNNKWYRSCYVCVIRSLKELAEMRARQIVSALQTEPMTLQSMLVRHQVERYRREDIVG